MTDRKVDNPPVGPLGRSPQVGQTYIDTVTGEFKQVQQTGPDIVIRVISQENVAQEESGGTRRTEVPQPASLEEAKAQYSSLNKQLAKINSLLARTATGGSEGGVVRDEGVSYTVDSLRAQSKDLQAQVQDAKKFVDGFEKPIKDARSEIKKINDRLSVTEDEARAGQKPVSDAERERLKARKTELEKTVKGSTTKRKAAGTTGQPQVTAPTATTTAATAGQVDASTGMLKQSPDFGPGMRARPADQFGATAAAGGGTGGGAGTGGGGGGRPTNPKRGQEWTGPKGATWRWDGTKWNRVKKGTEAGPGGGANLANIDVERLKKDYPGYAWIWELSPEFADTQQLWADYLDGNITVERFNNLIGQSSWYTDQRTGNETRRIKNRYGDILDGGTLSKLVSESIKFQYEDDELDTAFFNSALAKNVVTGEYIDPKAAKIALSSNLANSYRNFAKSMFLSADDQEIEDLLIGKATEEDFYRNKRSIAKSVYTNWASLLDDPTMTMEKIVKPWKDMAAQVLEMDPNQIDMSKPQFQVAYAGSPDGKMGAMSLGEWYTKLRSDNTYGWNKTTGAKQEARELAYNLARTFGKA